MPSLLVQQDKLCHFARTVLSLQPIFMYPTPEFKIANLGNQQNGCLNDPSTISKGIYCSHCFITVITIITHSSCYNHITNTVTITLLTLLLS